VDRETKRVKRQAYTAIAAASAIFVFVSIGLILMGIKSINVDSVKVLRSEWALKIKERENFSCTAEWVPEDAFDYVDAGMLPNPMVGKFTFAMGDDGDKFYVDRYFDGEKYISIYADDGEYYVWSAMRMLWESGQLRASDYSLPTENNIKMNAEEFAQRYPNFYEDIDKIIRDFPAGVNMRCKLTGGFNYSEPQNYNWHSLQEIEEIEKQEKEDE